MVYSLLSSSEPGWQVRNVSQSVVSEWVQLFSHGKSAYLNKTYNPYVDRNVSADLVSYYGLNDALSTYRYQCPVRRTAAHLLSSGDGSVYLYSFNYVPTSSRLAALGQAVHGEEPQFVFNTSTKNDPDVQIFMEAMSLLWIRFAVHGNPNTPLTSLRHTSSFRIECLERVVQLFSLPKALIIHQRALHGMKLYRIPISSSDVILAIVDRIVRELRAQYC